jgi:hypothetical protein
LASIEIIWAVIILPEIILPEIILPGMLQAEQYRAIAAQSAAYQRC